MSRAAELAIAWVQPLGGPYSVMAPFDEASPWVGVPETTGDAWPTSLRLEQTSIGVEVRCFW